MDDILLGIQEERCLVYMDKILLTTEKSDAENPEKVQMKNKDSLYTIGNKNNSIPLLNYIRLNPW